MAHTVQRSNASGKRKAAPSSSDPPTPSPRKKAKVATARKSTGGRAPAKRSSGGRQSEGCERVLCYSTWMLTGVT
jgi:histone H3-like centromeric protein A